MSRAKSSGLGKVYKVSVRNRDAILLIGGLLCFSSPSPGSDERFSLNGNFIQGGMVVGHVVPGAKLKLDGRTVMVAAGGEFVFGFDRDYGPQAVLTVSYADGSIETRDFDVAQREYDVQRIDGLPPSKVTPQTQEQIDHILRDQALKREARKLPVKGIWFKQVFDWPVTGIVTGVYGSQRILNGELRRPHYGIDIAVPTGTDVVAPAGGVVILAQPDMYFEGGLIFLDHGHGFTSGFLHMDRIDVVVGDMVEKGQVIGTVGATGRVTGSHLDWRINWSGQQIDPELLAGPMPQSQVESLQQGG